MNTNKGDGIALDEDVLSRLRSCLSRHPVSFVIVFGSAVRDETTAESDLDLAVAFDSLHPEDDGYSDAYLRLQADLDDVSPVDVDAVDIRSMPPSFGRVVFDEGTVVLGSEEQRDELEREFAGDRPSVTEARNRMAAATERLRENAERDRGKLSE